MRLRPEANRTPYSLSLSALDNRASCSLRCKPLPRANERVNIAPLVNTREIYTALSPFDFIYLFIYLFFLPPFVSIESAIFVQIRDIITIAHFFFYTVNVFLTFSKFLEIFTLFEGKNEGNSTRVNVTLLCSVEDLKDIRSKFLNYRKRKYFCLSFQRKSRPLLLFITRRENVVPREIVTTYVFNPN